MILSKVRVFAFVLSSMLCFSGMESVDNINTEPDLYARSAVLMDADTGRVLYGKNEEEIMANASTTKILTCILVLETGDTMGYAKVSSNAEKMPKVHLGMTEGQYFKVEDLLHSLMLESHNDSAVALAEYVSGSVEQFSALMNKKAESIGCEDTYFITPNGLDASVGDRFHSTTAKDLAKIMAYCVNVSPCREKFLEICRCRNYTFTDYKQTENGFEKGRRSYNCTNKNAFLNMMEGVLAGKTGFTGKAGYCYVAALESEGRTFVVALLACGWPGNKNYKWSDAKKLFAYGMENYHYENIIKELTLPPVPVLNAVPYKSQSVPVYVCDNTEEKEMLLGSKDSIEVRVYLPKNLTAPVERNEKVGKVEYLLNEEVIKTCDIRTVTGIQRHSYEWSLFYVVRKFAL